MFYIKILKYIGNLLNKYAENFKENLFIYLSIYYLYYFIFTFTYTKSIFCYCIYKKNKYKNYFILTNSKENLYKKSSKNYFGNP